MWWTDGDSDEEESDEEAFVSNYIPQCFFIDGSRGRRQVNPFGSFTFFNAGETELLGVIILFYY